MILVKKEIKFKMLIIKKKKIENSFSFLFI